MFAYPPTALIVEADEDQAVVWTKPADWELDSQDPWRGLGSLRPGGFLAGLVDGKVVIIAADASAERLRQLFSTRDETARKRYESPETVDNGDFPGVDPPGEPAPTPEDPVP